MLIAEKHTSAQQLVMNKISTLKTCMKCQIKRFDLFSQEGLHRHFCCGISLSSQSGSLPSGAAINDMRLFKLWPFPSSQRTERKQEKELQLPVPEQSRREGWRRWRKRKGEFICVRIEGCVRTGVSDRHSVSETEPSSLWMWTNWSAVPRGDHESPVLCHAVSDWLLAHR